MREPTFEEIKAKAIELYIRDKGSPPPCSPDEKLCKMLKLTPSPRSSYWTKARKILLGKIKEGDVKVSSSLEDLEYTSLLTPKEASRMLGVSYKTLWRWWREGKINAIRLPSGRLRYPKNEIERILQVAREYR